MLVMNNKKIYKTSIYQLTMENSQFKVAIIYNKNKKAEEGEPEDFYAEFDDESVPQAIRDALLINNFNIDILEADKNLYSSLENGHYDFAFNIAEGLYGKSRESQVPAMLEWLRIPYTASGIFTMALSLDKRRTKETLLFNNIKTPKSQLFRSLEDKLDSDLEFPLIVKPNSEGSSKGIDDKSIVQNEEQLRENVKKINETYKDSALAEEFLPGREFTVGLMGNKNEKIYRIPAVEIFVDKYENSKGIYTYEHKYLKEKKENSDIAILSPELKKKVYDLAIASFNALDCKDFGRVDIRCNAKGEPEVIEINPIPGLHPDPEHVSYFTKACTLGNIGYTSMINSIFMFALERHGLEDKMNSGIRESVIKTLEETDKMCE